MESVGVAIDRQTLATLSTAFAEEISRLEQEIYADVGHQFTIGSPKQLEQVLFYELNLPRGRRTKTGFSTDAGGARGPAAGPSGNRQDPRVARVHEAAQHVRRGAAAAARRTHGPAAHDLPPGGRVDRPASARPTRISRTSRFGPTSDARSATPSSPAARTSCCSPPTTARSSCASSPTSSGDVHLKEAFERRADIHRETAARVLKKDPADVTADERSMAKMVNFGLAYGMSDFGLSSRANIPRAEAQEFINSYFAAYSGISYYMMHIKEVAREQGNVTTLFGRRRWIPELSGAQRRAAQRRRADGHQHAHPGHGRGHREDRDDPALSAADARRLGRPDAPPGPRRAAARGAAHGGRRAGARSSARRWRARSSSTCR